jgi:hypothetical protein
MYGIDWIPKSSNVVGKKSFFDNGRKSDFFFQPKLKIGPVDDIYEREADAMAERVMRREDDSQVHSLRSSNDVQLKCAQCEEDDQLQRKTPDEQMVKREAPTNISNVLSDSGKPLASHTKAFMEDRFGCDFTNVRVHTGTSAAQSAQSINALAYTNGNSIVFNDGQYSPGTYSGNKLLAHELTHVIQQGGSDIKRVVIEEGKPNPMQPGAYDHLGNEEEIECDPGEVDDAHVQELIDESLALYDGLKDIEQKLDMAWSYLYGQRETHCCDYDLAAAEHYMWARKEVAAGWPAWWMVLQVLGYELFKGVVPQAGECPKVQRNGDVVDWGIKGAGDGNLDYYGGYPPLFL